MKMRMICALLWCVAFPARADLLMAPATKGTLNVEYTYDASGKTQDQNDTHEWRVKRVVKMTLEACWSAQLERLEAVFPSMLEFRLEQQVFQ